MSLTLTAASPTEGDGSPTDQISDAARLLGKRGGRPKGSCSSPLAIWLRAEIDQRQNEGYRCREAFEIARDSETPDGNHAFIVSDYTSDDHDIEPGTRVSWSYFRKLWSESGNGNRFV